VFVKAAEEERAEVERPDAILDLLEPDGLSTQNVTAVDPAAGPPDPAVGTDEPDLVVGGVLQWGEAAGQLLVTPETDVRSAVMRASGTGATGLKFYVGIDAPAMRALADEAHRLGLQAWAHSAVFPDRPMDVLRAGVDGMSHIGWLAWEDRDLEPSRNVPYTHTTRAEPRPRFDPQLVQVDSPEMTALFAEMARRGTILDATYSGYMDGSGSQRGTTPRFVTDLARAAKRSGVRISTGTDYFVDESDPFPSVFSEIEHLVADVLSPAEVIAGATLNGARAIGIEDTHGTIAPGKIADLIVLRDDPTERIGALRSIVTVMKSGRIYPRSEYEPTNENGQLGDNSDGTASSQAKSR